MGDLWQLVQGLLDDSAPSLEALGLSPKAFFLLQSVLEYPFPAELARLMHLPPPTITYLVKQLEAGGLVERRMEPGDLRKFRLVVTEAGSLALEAGREALTAVLSGRLTRLEAGEIRVFGRLVKRLARPEAD